ncbi:stAR-related lipid transfer protein 7, mitochondrial-like isoform X2 [Chelonus insularis]|uniref:stAR-related lipid transfer protein 7, mitochondrial-like isoform X2 n=1 Tax=Chelonus insularis TaxID=460826 RepID=UPI00158B02E3|nr:stAR-related lipid transfer protein 7, mitochondrial-like isoform X2 [Chelonus insularis]
MYSSNLPHLVRLFNHQVPHSSIHKTWLTKNSRFYGKYKGYGRKISIWFSEQSLQVAKACTRQFEFIAAQRVRRSLQFFQLYAKILDDIAFKKFMRSWRRRLTKTLYTREFFISAVGVTMFNWDEERIADEELYGYAKEIEKTQELCRSTVVCKDCSLRLIIDHKQPNVEYCTCHGSKPNVAVVSDEWKPFIERQDMLIWRKEDKETGLYAYKVFGTYADVSAEEFLQVQVDIDYRKVWDPTARELEIIDTDPKCASAKDYHNDVIYWEMIWPRLFSNRDYVYKRKWIADRDNGIVVIANKNTNHPNAPNRPDTYRVTSYWSYTVIKASEDFNKPGIQFVLTYFEDPGVNIPTAVTTWVAASGLPDFLCRMRQAAKEYKTYIQLQDSSDPIYESEETFEGKNIDTPSGNDDSGIEINEMDNGDSTSTETILDSEEDSEQELESDIELSSEQTALDQPGFFRYYFLTKLFA